MLALLGATALTAPGLARAQATAADVAAAIDTANSTSGTAVVTNPANLPISLAGATLPALTSGTLQLGSGVFAAPIQGGTLEDDSTLLFEYGEVPPSSVVISTAAAACLSAAALLQLGAPMPLAILLSLPASGVLLVLLRRYYAGLGAPV
jgi:hypothetical protein